VIAAPGSGKTVLGIEVVKQINHPALILVPTIAIRNQWIERLVELFLPAGETKPEWISNNIKEPKFFTVSTYQGLHSAISREDVEEEESEEEQLESPDDKPVGETKKEKTISRKNLIAGLKEAGTKTIVVDEAHHLRTNWWKSLTSILTQIEDPTIVALTATPPFDVSETEWNRYQNLCGPVDSQISVPELVKEKNLCPHQDYVMFSTPAEGEIQKILKFKDAVDNFVKKLYNNHPFTDHVRNYPWLNDPIVHLKDILDDPTFFSSLIIYLNHLGIKVPRKTVNIITTSPRRIPLFDYEWLEILLEGLLFPYQKKTKYNPPVLEEIKHVLNQIGALERQSINFRSPKEIENILKKSTSKLKSIQKIVELEHQSLGTNLRMVILTDYIRKSYLPREKNIPIPLNKIGVVPIFESLRRKFGQDLRLGILSGSLIIIPKTSLELLKTCATTCGVREDDLKIRELPHTPDFVEIDMAGRVKQHKVQVITELFTKGGIHVLVGTKSLLGEGWDAPSINTLILATFVGSYMLSNQMRGRAIRTEQGNPEKTANIWHLICVEPKPRVSLPKDKYIIVEDFMTLSRRFRAFVGPSFKQPMIESGLKRLNIGDPPFTIGEINKINRDMTNKALDRKQMRIEWELALRLGEDGVKLVEDIKAKKEFLPRGFVFLNTISAILWEGVAMFLFVLSLYLNVFGDVVAQSYVYSVEIFNILVSIGFLIPVLIILPYFLKATWLFIKHGPIRSSMHQISIALLKTLIYTGAVETEYQKLRIVVKNDEGGSVFCHLEGGTNREKSIFLDTLHEILSPVENPRYIMIRKSYLLKRLGRLDYHSVPSIIGVKKKYAQYFSKMWKKHVGTMELVYTRNLEGRMRLLQARNHSLSSHFVPRSERINRWC
jgi:superfamily II DNA or RNA helicase